MPEPNFDSLKSRLRSIDEDSLREIRTINELIAAKLGIAVSTDGAATEAQSIHLMCADALGSLRLSDARPTPKALHAARWVSQYIYAIILTSSGESVADSYGRAANAVFDEYKGKADKDLPGVIYFIRHQGGDEIKIGFALEGNLESRLSALRTAMPNGLEVLLTIPGTMKTEADLHARFTGHRISSNNEWFRPSQEIMEFIASMGAK